ncbi:MAG TPA: hypothetical protein VJ984_02420 [Xanthomonadales bacterium]|nr:hypothetical protein [Xanthomonadales bacterium]
MTRFIFTLVFVCLLSVPFAATAQEEDEGPASYLYATYHYCTTNGQGSADEIYEQNNKPIYEQMLADGKITAYGWLAHHTGGKWRRVGYYAAPTLGALLDAGDAFGTAAEANDPDGKINEAFGTACPSHDDYIWASSNVGTGAQERGPAGFSVYFVCDETREARADEIMAEHFAPQYDKAVEDGKLTSWGWSEHWVGGKYRRLLTTTAADHKTGMMSRNELISSLYESEEMEAIGEEFTDICGSHSDYMWDIVHEKP